MPPLRTDRITKTLPVSRRVAPPSPPEPGMEVVHGRRREQADSTDPRRGVICRRSRSTSSFSSANRSSRLALPRQADTTHWRLSSGAGVEILNIVDDHSRLLVASVARPTMKVGDVVAVFLGAFATWGVPASVLTDNAAVFTGSPRGGGRNALEVSLGELGIRFIHSSPYHPQTCGKVERFHQTLKKRLVRQRSLLTIEELQIQLDRFQDYYNGHRPHRALGRRTQAEAFVARPKAGPSTPGLVVPGHVRVRKDRVDKIGRVDAPLQQPSPPHRAGASSPGQESASPRCRSGRSSHHRGRRGASGSDFGPAEGLPTPEVRWKDVPRHLCTMSRDITFVGAGGFEPPTSSVSGMIRAIS